jgi:hypothetical protein
VPAAAVIRRVQALPGFIGRKEFRRRFGKLYFKDRGLTSERGTILPELNHLGATGTYHVGVKSVDMIRNVEGEGR